MRIQITIQGISPLLMNRFHEENELKVSNGTSSVMIGGKGTSREQAEKKAYRDSNGKLYIPGVNIYASVISAGRFHKVGKSKVTTNKTSLIPAGIIMEDVACELDASDFEVDSRSVVIPSTGGRIMCHRPRVDHWSLTFRLLVDDEMFAPRVVRMLVDDAGKKVGLGDFRPERKGPFGRFVVKNWQELADETETKAA